MVIGMESYGPFSFALEAHRVGNGYRFDLVAKIYGAQRVIASRACSDRDHEIISNSPRKLMDLAIDLFREGL